MPHPVVAIVGAPNVGKSTLFNRLLGRRQAIVADFPGVTRDRLTADTDILGRMITLVDTGGVVAGATDDLTRRVGEEALKAVEIADVILFMIDARTGLTTADEHVGRILRISGRPIVPVANKIDSRGQEGFEFELYRLGLGEVVPVSAEQGNGIAELLEAIVARLPAEGETTPQPGVALAIVGRPNVGKSSLFNRILQEERSVVSEIAGTTRDPVDATFTREGVLYRIVDTAGIRRRLGGADTIEWVSVLKARQALERAELVIALLDATREIEHQDRALMGLVIASRRPAVVAMNKVDLLDAKTGPINARIEALREEFKFSAWVPVVPISALTGSGIAALLTMVARVHAECGRRFSTPELNRALEAIVKAKHPPADGGRDVRFHYITQAAGAPPRFLVFGNGRRVPESYRRYMEHRLRERLGLEVSPITLVFRRRPSR
jgi:GTP-binding protein